MTHPLSGFLEVDEHAFSGTPITEADRRFPSGGGRFRKTMWRLRQLPSLLGSDRFQKPFLGLLAAFQSFGKGILGIPVRQTLGRQFFLHGQ